MLGIKLQFVLEHLACSNTNSVTPLAYVHELRACQLSTALVPHLQTVRWCGRQFVCLMLTALQTDWATTVTGLRMNSSLAYQAQGGFLIALLCYSTSLRICPLYIDLWTIIVLNLLNTSKSWRKHTHVRKTSSSLDHWVKVAWNRKTLSGDTPQLTSVYTYTHCPHISTLNYAVYVSLTNVHGIWRTPQWSMHHMVGLVCQRQTTLVSTSWTQD